MLASGAMRLPRLASTIAVLAVSAVSASATLAAGCASRGQVHSLEARLEARLAASERAAQQRAAEDAAARIALEGKLMALQLELARLNAGAERADALGALAARVEKLEQRPPAPAPRPALPQPDPDLVYAVPVTGAPSRGPDDALVTIVRAGEYACPYCEKVRPTLDALAAEYGPKLRIVYRSYVVHPQVATIPARAACAAHKQRRFWDMDRLLWEKAFATREFSQERMEELAAELGLDHGRFVADLEGACVGELKAEMALLERFGVRATPGFFINGRFLSGARPIEQFRELIDEELKKAEERVAKLPRRARRQPYYEQVVMATGLPGLAPAAPAPIAAPAAP